MNSYENDIHVSYGCIEFPVIRINLMEDDKIIYSFTLDTISYYRNYFGNSYEDDSIYFYTTLINPTDYAILTSKHYDKYILDIKQIWHNSETGEDAIIESPSRVFYNMRVEYVNCETEPGIWRFCFKNR